MQIAVNEARRVELQDPIADGLQQGDPSERCETLLACDGGVVYMGAAMGCATISLWGPGVMERFKPPGDRHIGVRMDYACIPCVTWDRLGEFPSCPYRRRCYNDLEASAVFDAYCRLKGQLKQNR